MMVQGGLDRVSEYSFPVFTPSSAYIGWTTAPSFSSDRPSGMTLSENARNSSPERRLFAIAACLLTMSLTSRMRISFSYRTSLDQSAAGAVDQGEMSLRGAPHFEQKFPLTSAPQFEQNISMASSLRGA